MLYFDTENSEHYANRLWNQILRLLPMEGKKSVE